MRSPKNKLPYEVGEDTIYGVDFSGGIADALSRSDYREAVRLLYLQTLKRLSDEKRIDWQPYKTPTQYINEVRIPVFRQLTNHFLRVRYGNFGGNGRTVQFHEILAGRNRERRGLMRGSRWFIFFVLAFLLLMFAIEYHLPKKFCMGAYL